MDFSPKTLVVLVGLEEIEAESNGERKRRPVNIVAADVATGLRPSVVVGGTVGATGAIPPADVLLPGAAVVVVLPNVLGVLFVNLHPSGYLLFQ